jgi:hypothetical protein
MDDARLPVPVTVHGPLKALSLRVHELSQTRAVPRSARRGRRVHHDRSRGRHNLPEVVPGLTKP